MKTDLEVLNKAIEIAIKNGLEDDIPHSMFSFEFHTWNWHNTIFSHNFAKAFWGDKYVCHECMKPLSEKHKGSGGHKYTTIAWKGHLQQMVLENNPIDYLRRFIDERQD